MSRLLFILSFLLLHIAAQGQYITMVRTVWDDRFTEWEILDEETGESGEIRLRWTFPLDWTVWDIRWGDTTAEFSQTWRGNPEQWDLVMGTQRVTARTRWPGDYTEWRIRYMDETVIWKPVNQFNFEVWESEDLKRIPYRMYTLYEGDPRDWVIEDELREDAFPLRLLLIMLTIYHSTPK